MSFRQIQGSKVVNVPESGPPKRDTTFGIYPAYLFTDHDPIIDQVFSLIEKAGLVGKLTKVATQAHVSPTTLHNWDLRKTKRPQFATVKALVNSLGGKLVIRYLEEDIGE